MAIWVVSAVCLVVFTWKPTVEQYYKDNPLPVICDVKNIAQSNETDDRIFTRKSPEKIASLSNTGNSFYVGKWAVFHGHVFKLFHSNYFQFRPTQLDEASLSSCNAYF